MDDMDGMDGLPLRLPLKKSSAWRFYFTPEDFSTLDFSAGNCDFAGAPEPSFAGRETMRKLILMLAGLAFLCSAANAQTAAQPGPAAPPELKSAPDARVKKLLDARKIDYELTRSGNFRVNFSLPSGRNQPALIMSQTYRYMHLEIREILSPAYKSATPFTAEVANRLLSDNNEKKLGAWVTQKENDSYCAVFVTKIPADCDDEYFVSALRLTLQAADEMKKELTGKDEF
jgi:hypothetical protein